MSQEAPGVEPVSRTQCTPRPKAPSGLEARLAFHLLHAAAPPVPRTPPAEPPAVFAPFETFDTPHAEGEAPLRATWYAAQGDARGVVLLAHPWVRWGQAYFHRYRRVPALRAAGFHVLTFDLSGFGGSGPLHGFWDRDIERMVDVLARRAPGLPWHFWGVSSGGVWGHVLMSRRPAFAGAMFEDVAPHLLEWSWQAVPSGRPFYFFFRTVLRRAYRYLDLRLHAPWLGARAVAHVVGALDVGIPLAHAERLSELARGELLSVSGAMHLESIRMAQDEILALALRTFGG